MKESTSVLRQLNEQVGGVEGVDRVMDALREEREMVEVIGGVINENNVSAEGVDEEEVEREFEALMERERPKTVESVQGAEKVDAAVEQASETERAREQQEEQATLQLPDVPTTEPAIAEVGFQAVERPRRERSEEEMEKRLSAMSLDEEPFAGKENEPVTEQRQSLTKTQHEDRVLY